MQIAIISSKIKRGMAVAKALYSPNLKTSFSPLVDYISAFPSGRELSAYVLVVDKISDLNLVHKKIFDYPCVVFFEGDPGRLAQHKFNFDKIFFDPFNFLEISLYLRYLVFSSEDPVPQSKFQVSDLVLDLETRDVRYKGNSLNLCHKEFCLLEFLVRQRDKALTRNQILESVWDRNVNIFTNTVDVHIGKLRHKIDSRDPERFIRTIHGFGYLFTDPGESVN